VSSCKDEDVITSSLYREKERTKKKSISLKGNALALHQSHHSHQSPQSHHVHKLNQSNNVSNEKCNYSSTDCSERLNENQNSLSLTSSDNENIIKKHNNYEKQFSIIVEQNEESSIGTTKQIQKSNLLYKL